MIVLSSGLISIIWQMPASCKKAFSELRPYCYRAAASNRSFMPAHQQKHSNTKAPARLAKPAHRRG